MYICVYVCRSNVPCCLYWQSPEILLVGRGHLVKVKDVVTWMLSNVSDKMFVREREMLTCLQCVGSVSYSNYDL